MLAAVALLTAPRLAAADEGADQPLTPNLESGQPATRPAQPMNETTTEVVRSSYHLQLLAADGLAVTVALAYNRNVTGERIAGGMFAVGPAMIHLAHGHYGRAIASVGLRAALPAIGMAIGWAQGGAGLRNGDLGALDGAFDGMLIGVGVGALAAALIDNAALGGAEERERPTRTFTPTLAASAHGGMSFGVAGSF